MKRWLTVCAAALFAACASNANVRGLAGQVRWQWQLSGEVDTSVDADVYDVDLAETPDAVLAALKAKGRYVICYFSAGSKEAPRADVGVLPPEAVGLTMEGYEDEQWLDVRHPSVRLLMLQRLDRAKARGCNAVEPDNVDGFENETGFELTARDQLDFNRFLAKEAHARGLAVALKNDVDQVRELVSLFDFALDEQCVAFTECEQLKPFLDAGKAVLHVEYGDEATRQSVCGRADVKGFSTLIKHDTLDAWRLTCP